MKKSVMLEMQFVPFEVKTKQTKNVVLAKLNELGAENIGSYATGRGPSRCNHVRSEFRTTLQAIQAATRISLSIFGMGYSQCFHFRVNGEWFDPFDFDDIACGEDVSVVEIIDFAWNLYRSNGGKMGRIQFLVESLGKEGGIDRVYVEEGLEPGFRGTNDACLA